MTPEGLVEEDLGRHETPAANERYVGMVTLDARATIHRIERPVARLLGYEPEVLVGRSMLELLPRLCGEPDQGDVKKQLQSLDGRRQLLIGQRRDSSSVSLAVSCARDAGARRASYRLDIAEVTDSAQAQYKIAEQTAIMNAVSLPLASVDNSGAATWVNPAFELMFGYSLAELTGKTLADVLVSESASPISLAMAFESARSGLQLGHQLLLRRKDRRAIWVSLHLNPVILGRNNPSLYLISAHDITAEKSEESVKTDFVSMVGHELRTPLTVVSGALEVIGSDEVKTTDADLVPLVSMALNNCVRLSKLIDDLLDINKIESGAVNFEPRIVSLHDTVHTTVKFIENVGRRRNIRIHNERVDTPIDLYIDPDRVGQVLVNLLTNAIKFSADGGEIKVTTQILIGTVRVTVRDHGEGIRPQFQHKLFERFSRDARSDGTDPDGFGLGLSICKGLMDQMGGRIGFNPEHQTGAEFFIELPLGSVNVMPGAGATQPGDHDTPAPVDATHSLYPDTQSG